MKDAVPFRFPIDPEALKIPHYLQIVKHPMDFSTIERKLLASNPVKPDPNPSNPRYLSRYQQPMCQSRPWLYHRPTQ